MNSEAEGEWDNMEILKVIVTSSITTLLILLFYAREIDKLVSETLKEHNEEVIQVVKSVLLDVFTRK